MQTQRTFSPTPRSIGTHNQAPVKTVQSQRQPRFQHAAPGPMMQFQRVIQPILRGEYMDIAQVLVISHHQRDVTILEVFDPSSMAKGHACGCEGSLRGHLPRGDVYRMISVFKLPMMVAFQEFGPSRPPEFGDSKNEDTLTAYFDTPQDQPTHWFPSIRRATRDQLDRLASFTGLVFEINTQQRAKDYARVVDNHSLSVFNARDMERLRQDMEMFADVAWGTPLAEARLQMALVAATENVAVAAATEHSLVTVVESAPEGFVVDAPVVLVISEPEAFAGREELEKLAAFEEILEESGAVGPL